MPDQVAGSEKGLACRLVETGIAEYYWFWDHYLHRRYVWTTRREPITLIQTAKEEPKATLPAPVESGSSEQAAKINPLQSEFHKLRIDLADLADPVTKVIADKSFYSCELMGPHNVALRGKVGLNDQTFLDCQVVVIKNDARIFNYSLIIIENCKFFDSKISNCTFMVVAENAPLFRQAGVRFLTPYEGDEPSPT